MNWQYIDLIEHFPDKIDQLLDALNRVRFVDYLFIIVNLCTWINRFLN
jgi:hypothetical protein